MKEPDARTVAGEWLGLTGQAAVPNLYEWLALSLQGIFSEDATVAALATGERSAIIVALEKRMLVELKPHATDDGARFTAQALPLNEGTSINFEEALAENPPRLLRKRTWSFCHGEKTISFTTTQSLRAMFPDENQPPQIELLARMAASHLGWGVPL